MSRSPSTASAGPETGTVLRVVVHGAPYAGKTTTARSLGVRLGQVVDAPAEDAHGRTLLFDWMEYVGGRFDGRPIRTQLVTVPGHDPGLRRRLLHSADAVLFVADTRSAHLRDTAVMFAEVRGQLSVMSRPPGIVVQANRRDDPTSVPLDELRGALGLVEGDDTVVIETVASDGEGVRQAFVYAVREGLRHLPAQEPDGELMADSADELVQRIMRPVAPVLSRSAARAEEAAQVDDPAGDVDDRRRTTPDGPPRSLWSWTSWYRSRR